MKRSNSSKSSLVEREADCAGAQKVMSGVVSGCDGSGYARWVMELLRMVICIVGRSRRESIMVSVVVVLGISTADLMTLFSMLSVLMSSVVCIVSFACLCRMITSDL